MTDQRRQLRALVDESMLPGRPVYVLTAAIVDPRTRDFRQLMEQLDREAADLGGEIHATKIARDRGNVGRLAGIEELMRDSQGVKFFTTVHAPILRGSAGEEEARQRCLAHLTVELTTRHRVGEIILDSRDGDPAMTTKYGRKNPRDIATVKALAGEGRIPAQLKIFHRHDKDYKPLWLADVAVYAAQQAITSNDPGRLVRLAEKMIIREASFLPIEQRQKTSQRRALSNGLDGRLAELHTQSLELAARLELQLGYRAGDQAHVEGAAGRVEQALARLERIRNDQARWEQQTGRQLPPLEDYTHRDPPGRER